MTELSEFSLPVGDRECSVLHRRALMSWIEEQRYLGSGDRKQYGLLLWPASIALALEISQRAAEFRGRSVLELGAGVGLGGIVSALVGASVIQTDRDVDALDLCAANAERNGVRLEQRVADWGAWPGLGRHDWVIGSDILYRMSLHDQLRAVFDRSVAAGGRLLLADPVRPASLALLERLERDGWAVRMTRWTVGQGDRCRTIGVFELVRRRGGRDG